MLTEERPDFFIIGAPKAGSTALHDALAGHPQLYASPVKEPKYFLTDGLPPARRHHRGPGDAHSAREWIWDRRAYEALFAAAPRGALCFESTPFYLWDRSVHARIARWRPDAKLIAVIRDPVDRAFSNWSHLRADGLEPEADFLAACRLEPARIRAGWAPFWRYLELGRYGEQLASLIAHFPLHQIRVVRYRELIDAPASTLDALCAFLGVDTGVLTRLPDSNVGRWAGDGRSKDALRRVMRVGASAGSLAPPQMWRSLERPLKGLLQRGETDRPVLDPAARRELIPAFFEDNQVLSALLQSDYSDWLSPESGGTYTVRKA